MRRELWSCALALAVLAALAPAAFAAQHTSVDPVGPIVGKPALRGVTDCTGGEIHDDGSPENGYGWNAATVTDGRDVDRFTPTSYPFTYTEACVCWVRLGADASISFNLQVWDDDGPGGTPGTLLGQVAAVANAVPTALPGAFYSFDISSLNLNITSGNVFIGPQWNATIEQSFFVCSDQSVTTPLGSGQAFANALPWVTIQSLFPNYRSLLVRAVGAPLASDSDLVVTKTGDVNGNTVTWTIDVTNNGPDNASNVVVTDLLPPEVTYVSDTCGGANVPPWTWNIGALNNGATVSCDITTTVAGGFVGSITNTAQATADQADPNPGNESSTTLVSVGSILEIPTLGTAGFALLALLLAAGAIWTIRRRTA